MNATWHKPCIHSTPFQNKKTPQWTDTGPPSRTTHAATPQKLPKERGKSCDKVLTWLHNSIHGLCLKINFNLWGPHCESGFALTCWDRNTNWFMSSVSGLWLICYQLHDWKHNSLHKLATLVYSWVGRKHGNTKLESQVLNSIESTSPIVRQ